VDLDGTTRRRPERGGAERPGDRLGSNGARGRQGRVPAHGSDLIERTTGMKTTDRKNFIEALWSALSSAGAPLRGLPGRIAPARRREKRLRLCETLSLGEKRFLAVVQVERQQFLVGGAGSSIALLTELPAS